MISLFFQAMKKDFHMHTLLSDGTPSPSELVEACISLGLNEISITDHDSLGSYPEVFELIRNTSLRIIPGAELDCTMGDLEIHMLGIGLDIDNTALNQHLSEIQAARKKRAWEQADAINNYYGRSVVDLTNISSRCQTFMNPHLIHAMIDQGLFDEYESPDRYKQAQQWMKKNITAQTILHKPGVEKMISMIHAASGTAVLAHPGYYMNGYDLPNMVATLKDMGMDGMEIIYPYNQEGSREFPTRRHEEEAIQILRELAERYELTQTTGSDAHDLSQLRSFHSRA
jgi:predicted metal-dependent phosphoesterase TrpH